MTATSSLLRAAKSVAIGTGLLAVTGATFQILLLFLWITVGWVPDALVGAVNQLAGSAGRILLFNSFALFVAAVPAAVFLSVRSGRIAGGASAAIVFAGCALLPLIAWSYRFPACLAAMAFALLNARVVRATLASWALVLLAAGLALSPVDVSLRVTGNGPRLVPAIAGLMTQRNLDDAVAGKVVIVGGDVYLYNEPRWMWVW